MNNYNYNAGYNGYNGYNQPYVNETVVQENVYVDNYGYGANGANPYYQNPMIVQPQPQVVVVEDRYNNN